MRRYTEDQAASVLRRIDEHAAWYKDPQSGCDYLLDQFAAIKLLLSEYIEFNKQYGSGKLSETQLELKTELPENPYAMDDVVLQRSPEPSHQCLVHWKL